MATRRSFLKQTAGAILLLDGIPSLANTLLRDDVVRLTILHSNDMHSRVDPFPEDDKKFAGQGGLLARAAIIREIRAEQEHVLLLDSGDIFQGTPYFNFFGGEVELKLMSQMGYDAATMGNHDFDAGLEGFLKQLPYAAFPFLVSNYDFSDTILAGKIKPYQVFSKGSLRVGVFGLGVKLEGLVPRHLFGNTQYLDPIETTKQIVSRLRHDEKCDVVVCLSHLGYQYEDETISDLKLAALTSGIDVILGGHTHTFLPEPTVCKNRAGESVLVNQVGWGGVRLGRLELICDMVKKKNWRYVEPVIVM